jgi:hypothetical protein
MVDHGPTEATVRRSPGRLSLCLPLAVPRWPPAVGPPGEPARGQARASAGGHGSGPLGLLGQLAKLQVSDSDSQPECTVTRSRSPLGLPARGPAG